MTAKTTAEKRWPNLAVGILLLALVVAVFWRGHFFFHEDDWIALQQMASTTFGHYVLMPDTEHWYPFFKLVFYQLLKVFGTRYDLLVLINCFLTSLNTFLLFLFYRRLFPLPQALALTLVYAVAAAHTANVWTAHNITLILSFGFFLASLLLTDSYVRRPQGITLVGLGFTAALAILSNNFVTLGLSALPLYAALQAEPQSRRRWRPLAAVVGLVYGLFFCCYLNFAGLAATTSHNASLLQKLPGVGYLAHLFFGAFLSPFLYLFWGHYRFPVPVYFLGVISLITCLVIIWRWGEPGDRRLGLWALIINVLPFLLASLVRYQRSLHQAFEPRYAVFTLMFTFILVGLTWRIISRRLARGWVSRLAPIVFLAVVVMGQLLSLPRWYQTELALSQAASAYYQTFPCTAVPGDAAAPEKPEGKFMPARHPGLTPEQKRWIRHFLSGPQSGS